MAKTKQQKQEEAKKIGENLTNSKSVVFTTFDGLSVSDSEDLRNSLRHEKVAFKVSKKTLLKKALADFQTADLNLDEFNGNIGVAYGLEDEVAPAKVLAKFAKNHEQLQIKGGLLENKFISKEKVAELSILPSKLELIAKTIATINAPIFGFVNVLAGNLRGLVNVLNAVKEEKQ